LQARLALRVRALTVLSAILTLSAILALAGEALGLLSHLSRGKSILRGGGKSVLLGVGALAILLTELSLAAVTLLITGRPLAILALTQLTLAVLTLAVLALDTAGLSRRRDPALAGPNHPVIAGQQVVPVSIGEQVTAARPGLGA
jgi:hypothetical protein